jgi:hypothetical protein
MFLVMTVAAEHHQVSEVNPPFAEDITVRSVMHIQPPGRGAALAAIARAAQAF